MPGVQNSKAVLDFLGTIGSKDRGDNVSLSNSAKALVDLADIIITEARANLDKGGNVATGDTASSMKAKDIQVNGTKLELDIEILSTYKFLNDGVKGVNGGTGKYSFKSIHPSKKMATALLKWARKRSIATKYKAISKGEKKNQSIKKMVKQADNYKSLAYAMATNIKKKGIRPTKFFSKAIAEGEKQKSKLFSKALRLDIIETLSNN